MKNNIQAAFSLLSDERIYVDRCKLIYDNKNKLMIIGLCPACGQNHDIMIIVNESSFDQIIKCPITGIKMIIKEDYE